MAPHCHPQPLAMFVTCFLSLLILHILSGKEDPLNDIPMRTEMPLFMAIAIPLQQCYKTEGIMPILKMGKLRPRL